MSVGEITARRPKNAIVILLDSLNRHMLGAYGGREFDTPNLDSFARRAVRFDRHYSGSLPCIPARHDILCGTIDFLWKPWGSIEIWERPLTAYLRAAGVVTKLVSDHPHLFEVGGENYHTDFTAWDYQRGHESDPWQTRPDPSWMGAPSFARGHTPYDNSRGYFRDEADFPGPRTMAAATEWLERSARSHDRFMLFIDEFDPHEPFDTPEPYASMYDSSWQGPHMIWPPYMRGALAHGVLTLEQARQIRACYGAKLTMIDAWLGKLLAAIERGGFYNDTAVIVCTDHGHYLGEKDIWGKPAVPIYEPLGHTPLLIAMPGVGARNCGHAHHQRRYLRDARGNFRRRDEASHARALDAPAHNRRGRFDSRLGAGGNMGTRDSFDRRRSEVCARAGRRQRAAQPVVESMVHDADTSHAASPDAAAGRPRGAGPDAGRADSRYPPALPCRRSAAVLGDGQVQWKSFVPRA